MKCYHICEITRTLYVQYLSFKISAIFNNYRLYILFCRDSVVLGAVNRPGNVVLGAVNRPGNVVFGAVNRPGNVVLGAFNRPGNVVLGAVNQPGNVVLGELTGQIYIHIYVSFFF